MILIGSTQRLRVREKVAAGALLEKGRDTVLLPSKLGGAAVEVGETIEVFVYTDSEDRPVATTQTPKAKVGDFACLRVIDTSRHGAFLDWGLDKDLFAPHSEQHEPMVTGKEYVVAVYLDNATGRVAAASKLGPFFDYDLKGMKPDTEVDLLVYGFSPLGVQVIVDDRFSGLVYSNETFQKLTMGQRLKGFVTKVRNDNKLDVRLQRSGGRGQKDAAQVILEALKEEGGVLPLGDKSTPEAISERLGLSKKAFKAAVGTLYKDKKVRPGPNSIHLIE